VTPVAATIRTRALVTSVYAALGIASTAAFVVGGVALALTLPYHDWDAFAFGTWSRDIAQHGRLDPFVSGPQESARPLFYVLQGGVWAVTGISYTAGRLLSLAFAVTLIGATVTLVRRVTMGHHEPALAAALVVAIGPFGAEALQGKSDVPAAAAVAVAAWLAMRAADRWSLVFLAVAASLAMVTKPTVVTALGGLTVYLAVTGAPPLRRIDRRALALAAGMTAALVYDLVMALRFHQGLYTYLGGGTVGGFYAQLAAHARWHAVLRADLLGPALTLPLTFGVAYALVRLASVRHRIASLVALAVALAWTFGGPFLAHVPDGPFASSDQGFAAIGFACIAAAIPFLPDEEAPSRRTLGLAAALGMPPLFTWVWGAPYADRLASAAWPGLVLLIALVLATGIRALGRLGPSSMLAPVPVIAVALWMSLAGFDGLHGSAWTTYRSLGWRGVWDKSRTLHLVMPSTQSSLATATPILGRSGRLITEDPSFQYFLPTGRVTTATPHHCMDVAGYRVFILLTADEAEAAANQQHALATPDQWADCATPKLRQLSDGSNGFAVFAVSG
jgi:hypothetical protein